MDDEDSRAGRLTGALTKANHTVERRAWLAFPHAVVKKFGEDRGGYLAALIAGLLSWMALQAQFGVLAAEVNVVRHDQLWPRRLPGVPDSLDTETRTDIRADQPVETTYRERSA